MKKLLKNNYSFVIICGIERKSIMFCVARGNRVEFFDDNRNMLGAINLYGSDVVSAYVNESGVGSAICEDGSSYMISCNEYGYTNYSQIY